MRSTVTASPLPWVAWASAASAASLLRWYTVCGCGTLRSSTHAAAVPGAAPAPYSAVVLVSTSRWAPLSIASRAKSAVACRLTRSNAASATWPTCGACSAAQCTTACTPRSARRKQAGSVIEPR